MKQLVRSVSLEDDKLVIIDQRLLPSEEKRILLNNEKEVRDAVRTLAVRGAPAIGITAAYGVFISLTGFINDSTDGFRKKAEEIIDYLAGSRPTAYNLFYALGRMRKVLEQEKDNRSLLSDLKNEALAIHREDLEKSESIGKFGSQVVPVNARVLTHCNAGGLATGGGGTALSAVYKAHQENKNIFVYIDETRPLLQGARLTAWELSKAGVPYQVITDNMAGSLMGKGLIDLVLVGADRIAKNGDFANKIGTYPAAVLAHFHGVPFYAAAPVSTFDFDLESGADIPIEERDKKEVLEFQGMRTAPAGADAYNPAFDMTPHTLLTGIITEFGIIYPPFKSNIESMKRNTKKD
jgi:methylthioribose-1-phosphate isomerase